MDGGADVHCRLPDGGSRVQPTDPAACHPDGGTNDGGTVDYGATLYNAEGDDDDCKYHLKFTSGTVREKENATFDVVATRKSDGAPATGAKIDAEVFLSPTHPAPNSNPTTSESPAGTYKVGPIRFDAPGRWTIRFHLYEDCADLQDESPHRHAAFYLDVP